mmetsp:Transcript_24536/g.53518  ORF Transcript_24536/g.53518 Transcript_24536/m.53518 type:complete len:223 (-) Transcript_24536:175-843(-)
MPQRRPLPVTVRTTGPSGGACGGTEMSLRNRSQGFGNHRIAFLSRRHPFLLNALQAHHLLVRGVLDIHLEDGVHKALPLPGWVRGQDVELAMVEEWGSLWQNLQILLQLRFVNAWKLPFHSSIPHHLGQQPSICLTFQQGLHGFHFTNGCVTMLPQIQIKGFHLRRLHSQLAQPVQRYKVGLGRIVRPGRHNFSGQLRDRRHAGVLPCHADRNKVAIHVAHA